MKEQLAKKLVRYLQENNPDLIIEILRDGSVNTFIEKKIDAIQDQIEELQARNTPEFSIEEICMSELTREYRPSVYNYILKVLMEDFQEKFTLWADRGVLQYEAIKLQRDCKEIFEVFNFSEENEDERDIRSAIVGEIERVQNIQRVDDEYLDRLQFDS